MATAIVLMFAGASSSWALFGLEDISYDGSLEVSGHSANNETDFSPSNDKRDGANTRVRVGVDSTVTENVTGRLEFTRTGRQYGTAATTIAGEEALWTVSNAFVDFDDILGLKKVRLGRQYVGEAGDLVWNISPTDDDSLSVGSIDGILFHGKWIDDNLDISIFTGKAAEDDAIAATDAATSGTGDVELTNVDVFLNGIIPQGRINLGLLSGDDDNTSARSDDNKLRTLRVGVKGSVSEDFFTYKAEFLQNFGEFSGAGLTGAGAVTDLDYAGNAIDLGVGVNINETSAGDFGLAANVTLASGDDNVTDDEDESFHDFSPLGFNTSDRLYGEIFGKSNTLGGGTPRGQGVNSVDATGTAPSAVTQGPGIQVIHLGAWYNPTWCEKGWFKIDFYSFTRAEDSITVTGGTTRLGEDFGTEFDFTFGFDPSETVNFALGYAILAVDDALTGLNAVNDENIEKWFARAKVAWGGEEE